MADEKTDDVGRDLEDGQAGGKDPSDAADQARQQAAPAADPEMGPPESANPISAASAAGEPTEQDDLDIRRTIIAGFLVLGIAFGGLGAWAALAPLTSAAIAPGTVRVSGERQLLQHLEGGIIEAILVEEGARVERGQTLIRLDETQPRAVLEALRGREVSLLATGARLRAERDGKEELVFPEKLLTREAEPDVHEVLDGERGVFESRRAAMTGQIDLLEQRKHRFADEVDALRAQRDSAIEQLALRNEELEAATIIYEKGIYEKPRYLALKRAVAALEGDIGELDALIARTHQKIGETDLQGIDLRNQWLSEVTGQLQSVTAEVIDLQESILAAEDVIRRIEIKAPQSGTVVGLQFHTVGGVIPPRARVMDIVPAEAALVIEAMVKPSDIDVVAPGLDCEVQLSAYSARSTPRIEGKVVQVSADSFTDEVSGRSYYRTLVEVDPEALGAVEGVELYPGMPAETFIKTGERSALDYLLEPLRLGMRRAYSQ